MVNRLVSVDDVSKQLPTDIREQIADNIATPGTPEYVAVAATVGAGGIQSTTVARIVVSEDAEEALEDGDLLIVVPSGVLDPPDITAPTVPTGLDAVATSDTTISLSWNASTDAVGVTGYRYRIGGGTPVDAGAGTTEVVSGLTASTSYTFEVSAYDAAGNHSGWSTPDSATTDADPAETYSTDFAGMTAEVAPTGWTSRWAAGTTFLVKDDGAASSGKVLRAASAASVRSAWSWEGGDTGSNVEILARFRPLINASGGGRLLLRGSGSSGSETGILFFLASTGLPTIGKYVAGAATTLGTAATVGTPGVGVWHRIRARVNGTAVMIKCWEEPDAEPGSWGFSSTVSDIAGPGWVGVMGFGATTEYDWISVAYDGATAPTVS